MILELLNDAEYIMRNGGLEETQAGIKIAGRNINNLRYADVFVVMLPKAHLTSHSRMSGSR